MCQQCGQCASFLPLLFPSTCNSYKIGPIKCNFIFIIIIIFFLCVLLLCYSVCKDGVRSQYSLSPIFHLWILFSVKTVEKLSLLETKLHPPPVERFTLLALRAGGRCRTSAVGCGAQELAAPHCRNEISRSCRKCLLCVPSFFHCPFQHYWTSDGYLLTLQAAPFRRIMTKQQGSKNSLSKDTISHKEMACWNSLCCSLLAQL